jgi:hypothetical protein
MSWKYFKLMLLLVVAVAIPVKADNLLSNPGFEDGVPLLIDQLSVPENVWWAWLDTPTAQSAAIVSPGYMSNNCAALYTSTDYADLGQDIAYNAGNGVQVQLMYNVPAGSWCNAGIVLWWEDAAGDTPPIDWAYAQIYNYSGGGSGGWQPFEIKTGDPGTSGTWICPANAVRLSFKIEQWNWEPSASQFDNVIVTPEPATIVMLGLGGLALIRRKRA